MANYNHYTPQSDGSYRRSTVPDPNRRGRSPYPSQPNRPPAPPPPPPRPEPSRPPKPGPPPDSRPEPPPDQGILSFLKGLLPRQIDAADLLVISLLLLMDREECDQGGLSPLLTIALYFLL